MNAIINISQTEIAKEEVNTVNARELHEFLEIGKDFTNWMKDRIIQYDFEENTDFIVFANSGVNPKGGRPTKEFHLSLDMAKEISMVERNDKGREARKYFIECEKVAKNPPQIDFNDPLQLRGLLNNTNEKLIETNAQVLTLQSVQAEMQTALDKSTPKVEAFDEFISTDQLYGLMNAARIIGARPKLFTRWLKQKYLFQEGGAPIPKAEYIRMGVFEVITPIIDDKPRPRTYITAKGIEYFRKRVPNEILVHPKIATA